MSVDGEQVQDLPLQFDRVVHVDPAVSSGVTCAVCGGAIGDSYYHAGASTLCAGCGAARQAATAPDRRLATLGRATLYGLGGAVAGAALYWAVMEYLGLEIGIVSIAIGYVIGRAVARATGGRSARRHRILAVALTYFAVGLAYTPFFVKGMREAKSEAAASKDSTAVATAAPSATAGDDSRATSTSTSAKGAKSSEPSGPGAIALGIVVVLGMVLALPVIGALSSGVSGLLSVLIIGIALKQAWRVSAAANVEVSGPFAIATAAAA